MKLEKFLKDKLSSEGGEGFARHLLGFIKRKCPGIGINPIPNDTFAIIFAELKDSAKVWPFITGELRQLVSQITNMQVRSQVHQYHKLCHFIEATLGKGRPTPHAHTTATDATAAYFVLAILISQRR